MSCDYLARHAIATFGAGCTPAERSYLQAVYDQPVALKPGEDYTTLSRAAQGLVLRLKAARADIPAHLDVKDTASRSLVRYGRLSVALAELQQRQKARQQADEAPAPTWGAWMRVALADDQPSRALKALQASGKIKDYPHIAALEGLEHDPYWHPEGPPIDHTGMVADEAAAIAERDGLNAHDRTVLVLTAVGHDFGKATTTTEYWEKAPAGEGGAAPPVGRGPAWQPDGNGGYHRRRIGSRGHEAAGEPMAEEWLRQIGAPESVIAEVKPLVRLHLEHIKPVWKSRDLEAARGRGEDVTALQAEFDQMVRDLAEQVKPSSLGQLARVIEADYSGRHPWPKDDPAAPIVARARELGLEPPAGGPAEHCPRCGRFMAADGSHGACSVQETFDGWYAEVRAAAAGGAISAEVAQVLRVTASDLLGNPRLDLALAAAAAEVRANGEQPEALRAMASALVEVRRQTRPERGLLDLLGWKTASSSYGVSSVEVEPGANGSTIARIVLNDGEGFEAAYDGYDARGNSAAQGEMENGVIAQVDDHPALLRLAAQGGPPFVSVEDGAVVLEFPPPTPQTPEPMLRSTSAQLLTSSAQQALSVLRRPDARAAWATRDLAVPQAINFQIIAAETLVGDAATPPEVVMRARALLAAKANDTYGSDAAFQQTLDAAIDLAEATAASPRLNLNISWNDDPAQWVAAAPDVPEVARGAAASPLTTDLLARVARVVVDRDRAQKPDAKTSERSRSFQAAVNMLQTGNQGAARQWAQALVKQATASDTPLGRSFAVQMAARSTTLPGLSGATRLSLYSVAGAEGQSPLETEQLRGVAAMASWVAGQGQRPAFVDYLGAAATHPSLDDIAAASRHFDDQIAEGRRLALSRHGEAGLREQERLPIADRSPEARYLGVATRYRAALRWLTEGGDQPTWVPPLPNW